GKVCQTRDIAAGSSQTGCKPTLSRIASGQEDDRNGRSNFLGGAGNQGVIRNDDLNLETKEFFSQRWQPLRPALSVPVLDKDGFVLDVAQVPQPLAKSFKSGGPGCARIRRMEFTRQKPDSGNFSRRLLRLGMKANPKEQSDKDPERGTLADL